MSPAYGCSEQDIGHYTCLRVQETPCVDGDLTKSVWQKTVKSPRFVDLVTGEPGFWDTRMSALWDDTRLYIAFWIEEPHVQAQFTERDSPVYFENDVEVFIAGEDCYYEFQINAQGTIYEVFYIWQDAYQRSSRFDTPEFDLLQGKVDVLGGFQDGMRFRKHPRGPRWAFMDWDFPGLEAAVQVEGTLNDNTDIDSGWTVELAFPWAGMQTLAGDRRLPPNAGDIWRMDFSRFQAFDSEGKPLVPSAGWAFNRHGVYDSHIPECFAFVHFSGDKI